MSIVSAIKDGTFIRRSGIKLAKGVANLLDAGIVVSYPLSVSGSKKTIRKEDRIQANQDDAVRLGVLELCCREISENKVAGAAAELGVYKGDFAKKINEFLPDKKLYLFDTFEGFDQRDIDSEISKKFSDGKQDFSNTSVDLVLSKMKDRSKCVVKKGYFPETAKGLEDEQYSFVSIDADLYQPILDGLKYFFPRLTRGGILWCTITTIMSILGANKRLMNFAV